MRYSATAAALCLLCACEAGPSAPVDDAKTLAGDGITLTLAVRGRGEVRHTADQAGATTCSTLAPGAERADCVRNYALNTVVTLTTSPAAGFAFHHWSGRCTGTGSCTITMNERRVLEAIFRASVAAPTSFALKILVRGRGEVKHSPDLAGATACGPPPATPDRAECARSFTANSEIVLEAVPATGARFPGWTGACTPAGAGRCTLKVNENRTLEVKFEG